jgi:hypothetical protein
VALAGLLVVFILLLEGSLTILRRRELTAAINVTSSLPTRTPTPTGTWQTGTPAPINTNLEMTPDGQVLVNLRWAYRIGPRFPRTIIRVQALNEGSIVVASANYLVNCGTEALLCEGSSTVALRFGVRVDVTPTPTSGPSAAGTPSSTPSVADQGWKTGTYTIEVLRSDEGFAPTQVSRQTIYVVTAN